MIFCNIQSNFNFIFGQFSVARKLILNSGAIRPIGLLFIFCKQLPGMIMINCREMDLILILQKVNLKGSFGLSIIQ